MSEGESISTASESVTPADLKVKLAEQKLLITWQDASRSEFDLAVLRRACPCATCRTERESQSQSSNPLQILKTDPAKIRVIGAKLVGHYAIQFEWSDGHNTGIYDFRFLKSLGG